MGVPGFPVVRQCTRVGVTSLSTARAHRCRAPRAARTRPGPATSVASALSTPRGYKLQNFRPAFIGDHRGTIGGGGGRPNPPLSPLQTPSPPPSPPSNTSLDTGLLLWFLPRNRQALLFWWKGTDGLGMATDESCSVADACSRAAPSRRFACALVGTNPPPLQRQKVRRDLRRDEEADEGAPGDTGRCRVGRTVRRHAPCSVRVRAQGSFLCLPFEGSINTVMMGTGSV